MPRDAFGESGCTGFLASLRGRREALRVGGLAGVALTLPDLLRARAAAPEARPADPTFGRARSVIMIYLHGGPAQLETWDPKPCGPSHARGRPGGVLRRAAARVGPAHGEDRRRPLADPP